MAFDLNQLNELDFETVGSWPQPVKLGAYLTTFLLVIVLFYYFDTSDQQTQISSIEKKEVSLKAEFETKYRKASNLDIYRQQMVEMEQVFKNLLQQLPTAASIPELIDDISFSESESGLSIQAGALQDEVKKEFYSEKPFSLVVTGRYNELGHFVSRVASLPRIVTLHDFTIVIADGSKQAKIGQDPELKMTIAAKTYRSLSDDELEAGGGK